MHSVVVYLLEDDPDDVYLVKELLNKTTFARKYQVKDFNTVEALNKTIHIMVPDIILVDLNVTDSFGLDTLVQVRQCYKKTPIIVLTGSDENEFGEKAIHLGAQDYLPKSDLTTNFLCRSIRYAKERFSLIESLSNQVSIDQLTLINNRRSLDERLNSLFDEGQRYNRSFAILFIDLNKFKEINDNYGHSAGDQLLKLLAARLKMFNRASDFVARYGGDEFVILAPEIDSIQELDALLKLKYKTLADHYCLQSLNGDIVEIDVTVSIGAAVFPLHGDTIEGLMEKADAAMYKAKQNNQPYCIAK
ncbi:diguanylate cyclase response regulator [Saccharobesus litoralis]|uniref:Diguanylate cyclase response regulator n=1 Tax=Saccharobesus litoralis TaxID=2172099 RepID=A0A2S0VLE5_9ALTE|nr:GGDEF domain-containing response regulator [Saccharobesus litoralis]AWB65028.1 diguanylate cyclase response regulator [Saccharobesus litoralis]